MSQVTQPAPQEQGICVCVCECRKTYRIFMIFFWFRKRSSMLPLNLGNYPWLFQVLNSWLVTEKQPRVEQDG